MLFSRSILAIEPSLGRQTNIHAEILRSFDAIAEARDARLNAVTVSLSATFWQVKGTFPRRRCSNRAPHCLWTLRENARL